MRLSSSVASKIRHAGTKVSPLSNWPRYPGGVIAGALIAVVSILIFLTNIPALRDFLRAGQIIAAVLLVFLLLLACISGD
jgi:hypothetical protein